LLHVCLSNIYSNINCQIDNVLYAYLPYIHYVSISTNRGDYGIHGIYRIYIPLCPYFNFFAHVHSHTETSHLHSTMSLFQPECSYHFMKPMAAFTFHYVPISTQSITTSYSGSIQFTFHYVPISTPSAMAAPMLFTIIYIPLCPYFNPVPPFIISAAFTIYIPLCPYFNCFVCVRRFPQRQNLHSTMSLFQHSNLSELNGSLQIYIPLCPYFTDLARRLGDSPQNLFTFHYVPISTVYVLKFCLHFHDLHSTMSLFQRGLGTSLLIHNMIYIPLCPYFNLIFRLTLFIFHNIYIPLCPYFNGEKKKFLQVLI